MKNIFNNDNVIPYRDVLLNFLSSFINTNDLQYKTTTELENIADNFVEYASDNKRQTINEFIPIQPKQRNVFRGSTNNNIHLDKFITNNQSLGFGGLKLNNSNPEFDIIDKHYPQTVERNIEDILYPTMQDFNPKKKLSLLDNALIMENYSELNEYGYDNSKEPGSWIMPCRGRLSSDYGWRIHPLEKIKKWHQGIDIANNLGTIIKAPAGGNAYYVGYENDLNGNTIRIDHGEINGVKVESVYIHLKSFNIRQGEYVQKGQVIGFMGSTGHSTGPHLHMSVYEIKKGNDVNPFKYIDKLKY